MQGSPRLIALVVAGGTLMLGVGCTPDLFANLFEERSGNIQVVVNNNTDYRCALTMGSWDPLDRDPPGPIDFDQQILEARTSAAPVTLQCQRAFSVGTPEFIERALARDIDSDGGVNLDAVTEFVNFSDAPADSAAAALPTVGTAEGREFLLGVDYRCADVLVITLDEDAAAPGGFRIGFNLIEAVPEDD